MFKQLLQVFASQLLRRILVRKGVRLLATKKFVIFEYRKARAAKVLSGDKT